MWKFQPDTLNACLFFTSIFQGEKMIKLNGIEFAEREFTNSERLALAALHKTEEFAALSKLEVKSQQELKDIADKLGFKILRLIDRVFELEESINSYVAKTETVKELTDEQLKAIGENDTELTEKLAEEIKLATDDVILFSNDSELNKLVERRDTYHAELNKSTEAVELIADYKKAKEAYGQIIQGNNIARSVYFLDFFYFLRVDYDEAKAINDLEAENQLATWFDTRLENEAFIEWKKGLSLNEAIVAVTKLFKVGNGSSVTVASEDVTEKKTKRSKKESSTQKTTS